MCGNSRLSGETVRGKAKVVLSSYPKENENGCCLSPPKRCAEKMKLKPLGNMDSTAHILPVGLRG